MSKVVKCLPIALLIVPQILPQSSPTSTSLPAASRFEIVQAVNIGKPSVVLVMLDKYSGQSWLMVRKTSEVAEELSLLRWQPLFVQGQMPKIERATVARFQIITPSASITQTLLLDTYGGTAWVFAQSPTGQLYWATMSEDQ